ncbi:MAG: outer membrane beta-barrel protein [Candidatus Zixiibacteriota bacterium]
MRKLVAVISLLILTGVPSAMAQDGPKLGVGAFAGLSFPLVQDDQGQGIEYGFKGRLGLGSIIVVEPYVSFVKWGEPDPIEGVDLGIDGSKVTAFGIDASLGNSPGITGISPYFVIGFGSYKVKNDDTGYDQSKLGFSGGLGLGIGLSPSLALDFRGKLIVAPQEEGGSKKAVDVVGGLNFSFGGQ